ncbi:MAG: von Willebrand factor type A domain-containing protein [Anaerolineae bacterium]|nr:von Willebrand factor type A domain-containing protein [Anaerolineae bacterium]
MFTKRNRNLIIIFIFFPLVFIIAYLCSLNFRNQESNLTMATSATSSDREKVLTKQNITPITAHDEEEPASDLKDESSVTTPVPSPANSTPTTDASSSTIGTQSVPQSDREEKFQQSNSLTSVTDDPVSTFALDVDTASYTLARKYINMGALPPAEVVRVEEFVNYFNYNYETPLDDVFNIHIEAAPSRWQTSMSGRRHIVQVGIQGRSIDNTDRPDVVLTLVIDISGSMEDTDRLPLVKESLRLLVRELRSTDRIGIVVYSDDARVELEHVNGSHQELILNIIDSLQTEESTNTVAGLQLGYEQANKYFEDKAINRIILSSDGIANVGAIYPEDILELARQNSRRDIFLTTIGFGMLDYNDYLMERLANDGDGQSIYVDSISAAERFLMEQLSDTLQTIARDAKVQIEFNPDVIENYRLLGYENRAIADSSFRDPSIDAGEVGAGHSVTALYDVAFIEPLQEQQIALTATILYKNPQTGNTYEAEQMFSTDQIKSEFAYTSPRYQLAIAVAAFADWLREGDFTSRIPIEQLRFEAERISDSELFYGNSDVQQFVLLVNQASKIKQ